MSRRCWFARVVTSSSISPIRTARDSPCWLAGPPMIARPRASTWAPNSRPTAAHVVPAKLGCSASQPPALRVTPPQTSSGSGRSRSATTAAPAATMAMAPAAARIAETARRCWRIGSCLPSVVGPGPGPSRGPRREDRRNVVVRRRPRLDQVAVCQWSFEFLTIHAPARPGCRGLGTGAWVSLYVQTSKRTPPVGGRTVPVSDVPAVTVRLLRGRSRAGQGTSRTGCWRAARARMRPCTRQELVHGGLLVGLPPQPHGLDVIRHRELVGGNRPTERTEQGVSAAMPSTT